MASLLLLMLTCVLLVNMTGVQNWLAQKAAATLSRKLKTKVTVAHVRIDLLSHLLLQGLYIEDQHHDTLLYAGEAQVRLNDWFVLRDKPVLHYLSLQNAYARLYRPADSKDWNYDFIANAFSTNDTTKNEDTAAGKPFEFDLEKVELTNVRFHMDDHWVGEDLDFDVGNLYVNADDLDINKKKLDIDNITARALDVHIREYKGGRPPWMRKHKDEVDDTPFNPGLWVMHVNKLALDGCSFRLTSDDEEPEPGVFDETHIVVKNIMLNASGIYNTADTLYGSIDKMSAQERSGIAIKNMRSKVSVSPNASICKELLLETNNSKLGNYYAMRYTRFPCFLNYIDSVVMEANLDDAMIDEKDIAFFAPEIKRLPEVVLRVNGKGRGTVSNLSATDFSISDGSSALKGDIKMKGLPDIYTTHISFTDGTLITSGNGILRYVPSLRNSPDVSLESIKYAMFRGYYEGLIEDFTIKGMFTTNIGTIDADIKMNIPGFNASTAVYSGRLDADHVQLGTFFKQPLLGSITLHEDFSGSSFDPDKIQARIDGRIDELELKGYAYHNLMTRGMLAKKEFDGNLLVDDPNLALEFDGKFNYADKNIKIKATAHLLGSNLYKLNLTKDTVTASADFDLDYTGNSIDNFAGSAKLFNIDLRRNHHLVALDSIYLRSTGDGDNRLLTVQSNDVVATIKGNYQLSKLPSSVQYYLSRYIPNYIKAPDTLSPDQNLSFSIKTNVIDSILAVTFPLIRGFDSSTISGSLNTTAQKLTLNARVPSGSIGNVHFTNIDVHGEGNLNLLGVNTTIDNVAIGDSIINGSLSLTASVGNDSVSFTIATTTQDTSSAITLNGQILAKHDSLFLSVFPSQFFLNQVKWDIAGGSTVVYSDKYLLVQGLQLSSGIQKITAATELDGEEKSLLIKTENLDLGQFGTMAGLADYQPDGRLNGTIKIEKLFGDLFISAKVRASNVKLGMDTVGTINIAGTYDGAKNVVYLSPQTGIFKGSSTVIAQGSISFDSATHQPLDGSITFNNAAVTWASPFLVGVMSNIGGTVNGKVAFKGSSYTPEMSGVLTLRDLSMHIDYTGCNYTIPIANVEVNNKRIGFTDVRILDAYQNTAYLNGYFSHNLFKDMRMRLKLTSDKFEALNLQSYESSTFYGNVIAAMDSFTIRGPFNNIRLYAYNARAVGKSRIYIPVTSGAETGSYSYASFKTYGKNQEKPVFRNRNKIHVRIDANLSTLTEMHLILDPASGDEIMARGSGNILLDIPPANDMTITGLYNIDNGIYTYTFKQLFVRQFTLSQGSTISFNGPFSETNMNVNAVYAAKARLYDLLTEAEKPFVTGSELIDAQTPQWVEVKLRMTGSLNAQKLDFDLDLADRHSQTSLAYKKLMLINTDPREKLAQVASLIVFKQFIPPGGVGASAVAAGATNNISQVVASSVSSQLTNIINKLTGDNQLSINLKYESAIYNDQVSAASLNRSQVSVGVSRNYLNDRLLVEVGSTSAWGKPTSTAATSNFNITGDFRIQYLLSHNSGLRLNAFRNSNYDVTLDRNIVRSGVGLSWRKSFDNLEDFFKSNTKTQKERQEQEQKMRQEAIDKTK